MRAVRKNHGRGDAPKWLMLGASGHIGRMLMRVWQDDRCGALRIIPQFRGDPVPGDGLAWSPLCGADSLRRWIDRNGAVAGIFMFAGVTPRSRGALDDNAALTEVTLAAAQATGIARVIVASSAAIYGTAKTADWCETDDPAPTSAYGKAKLAMEDVCRAWRMRGLDVSCLRIGNVAGADAALLNVGEASRTEPVHLHRFADAKGPVRSYIGVASLARALESLARHDGPLPPFLNVAAPAPITMESLLRAANAPFRFVPAPADAVQRVTLDCARLCSLHSFDAGACDPGAMVAEWQRVRDPL